MVLLSPATPMPVKFAKSAGVEVPAASVPILFPTTTFPFASAMAIPLELSKITLPGPMVLLSPPVFINIAAAQSVILSPLIVFPGLIT
jgi:hypothetical protein